METVIVGPVHLLSPSMSLKIDVINFTSTNFMAIINNIWDAKQ